VLHLLKTGELDCLGTESATCSLMKTRSFRRAYGHRGFSLPFVILGIVGMLSACYRPVNQYDPWRVPQGSEQTDAGVASPISTPTLPQVVANSVNALVAATPTPWPTPMVTSTRAAMVATPTRGAPINLPPLRTEETTYKVKAGDSLANIALVHQVSVKQILDTNEIKDPNLISIDSVIRIPPSNANELAGDLLLIPDSALVYGPNAKNFSIEDFIAQFNGVLRSYSQTDDEGYEMTGAQVVRRVAEENSFNPRLLLALLEFKSGWLTQSTPAGYDAIYPMGLRVANREGLYKQLSWVANETMRGASLYRAQLMAVWTLNDGNVMRIDPTLNPGTAGLQYVLGLLFGMDQFKNAIGEDGFIKIYNALYGYPFAYTDDALIPNVLTQPAFILPFARGDDWYLTGGPHWGWGTGSVWAAIDFAPPSPDDEWGCFESSAPVVALTDGRVVRSEYGSVVLDLDGDSSERTGWTVLYMHLASEGRVASDKDIKQGDLIGYASCEGGVSTGTHIHLARKYNGVWIPAFGENAFNLEGWVVTSAGSAYNGYLERDEQTIEAYNGRADFNTIGR
jgi:LasA protease